MAATSAAPRAAKAIDRVNGERRVAPRAKPARALSRADDARWWAAAVPSAHNARPHQSPTPGRVRPGLAIHGTTIAEGAVVPLSGFEESQTPLTEGTDGGVGARPPW